MSLPVLFTGPRKRLFASLVGNSSLQAVSTVLTGVLIQRIFDAYISHPEQQSYQTLIAIGCGLVFLALAVAWLRKHEYATAERLGQEYIEAVRLALFDCMQKTAVRTVQKRARGATLLRFIGDLNALRRWVSLGLSRIVVASITTIGATIALLVLHWPLAIIALLILVIGTGIMVSQGRQMREAVRETRRRRSHLATNISEKVASLAVIQVFGRARIERKRLTKQSDRLKRAVVQQASVTGHLRGISEATVALTTTSVLLLGVVELSAGNCSPGTVVATMGIIGMLRSPLASLARVYEYRQSAEVARQKLLEFLAMPAFVDEDPSTPALVPGVGRLEFNSVSVDGALDGFTAELGAGQVVVLVGPNGAGKTTLMAAAARLVSIDEGNVLLDGQDLATHTLASVHQAISMLSPDLTLMRGTFDSNLRYRCPKVSDEEFDRVVKLCGIDEVVQAMPEGLNARVDEGGSNLSPGQRQKISIARAIMGQPKVLLLDEADENLDPQSTQIVDRVIEERSATVLIVSHRIERVRMADYIWYMEDGQLVESGPAKEVMESEGPSYRHFYGDLRDIC